ncbi:MAG: LysE family translocator [Streptosporangiales bacterium]|nr:LysE family translocator [Streptosporangiales bacterium]
MPVSSILAFWVLTALLIVVPGPDWAFAITAGLRRQVVPAATGIVLGYVVTTAVVSTGLGLLVASTPIALTALTIIGGLYLAWLGIRVLRHPASVNARDASTGDTDLCTVLHGMAVSGLNPKGLLIFVAVLPQFTDPDAPWPIPLQMATLGMTFTLTCGVVYLCVGAAAQALLGARPSIARNVSRVSGAGMVVLGGALLVQHLTA